MNTCKHSTFSFSSFQAVLCKGEIFHGKGIHCCSSDLLLIQSVSWLWDIILFDAFMPLICAV